MRPEIEDAGLLWDMLQASREALAFIEGKSLDEYLSSLMLMRAIEREIEIIGEAARALRKPSNRLIRRFHGRKSSDRGMCLLMIMEPLIISDYGRSCRSNFPNLFDISNNS